jgi:hypothetical protein
MQDHPDVLQDLKKAMVQRFIRDELEKRSQDTPISDVELHEAYKASADEYNKPRPCACRRSCGG